MSSDKTVEVGCNDGTLCGAHEWQETYYGTECRRCKTFYPHGCAPWDDGPVETDDFDDEEISSDTFDDFDCHMDKSGHCGMAGSEECEFECPFRRMQR